MCRAPKPECAVIRAGGAGGRVVVTWQWNAPVAMALKFVAQVRALHECGMKGARVHEAWLRVRGLAALSVVHNWPHVGL